MKFKKFTIVTSSIILILLGAILGTKKLEALSYTPLDFVEDGDNFEVFVGLNTRSGERYYGYHYEFAD